MSHREAAARQVDHAIAAFEAGDLRGKEMGGLAGGRFFLAGRH